MSVKLAFTTQATAKSKKYLKCLNTSELHSFNS